MRAFEPELSVSKIPPSPVGADRAGMGDGQVPDRRRGSGRDSVDRRNSPTSSRGG